MWMEKSNAGACVHDPREAVGAASAWQKAKAEAPLTTSSVYSHFPPVAVFSSFPLPPALDMSLAREAVWAALEQSVRSHNW